MPLISANKPGRGRIMSRDRPVVPPLAALGLLRVASDRSAMAIIREQAGHGGLVPSIHAICLPSNAVPPGPTTAMTVACAKTPRQADRASPRWRSAQ